MKVLEGLKAGDEARIPARCRKERRNALGYKQDLAVRAISAVGIKGHFRAGIANTRTVKFISVCSCGGDVVKDDITNFGGARDVAIKLAAFARDGGH